MGDWYIVRDFPSVRSMVEADLRGWLPVMGVVLTEHQIFSFSPPYEPSLPGRGAHDDGCQAGPTQSRTTHAQGATV
jgi:hypothetical protein